MGRVNGKVALVTGAARGQGRAHALKLAEEGADIVAVDICSSIPTVKYPLSSPEDLEQTRDLVAGTGQRCLSFVADARDSKAMDAVVDEALSELGRLDIAVINHGILSSGPVVDMTDEMWEVTIDVNLNGVFKATRSAARAMVAQGEGGSVILTSSNFGLKGAGNLAHYAAAKHGVVGFARSLAIELAPQRIRVNTINPGAVRTGMTDNASSFANLRPDLEAPSVDDAAEVLGSLNLYHIPWIEAGEVSRAVVFLASDESCFITGVSLPVDMGSLQR